MSTAVSVPVATADDTRALGRRLAAVLRAGDLVVLSGRLGAGKTTFTQGVGEGLRVRGSVTSPTFVIARVHPSLVDGPALLHVDAYRLPAATEGGRLELDDLDLDAAVEDSVTVVEWGTGLAESLAEDRLEVELSRPEGAAGEPPEPVNADSDGGIDDEVRTVRLRGIGPRWADVDLAAV